MIQRMVPVLQVSNAEASLEFYLGKLGFQEAWRYQEETSPRRLIAVERDGIRLFLTELLESSFGVLLYNYVRDVDALAAEFAGRGVTFEWPPGETSWGTREFQIRDPDGNKLRFGKRLR